MWDYLGEATINIVLTQLNEKCLSPASFFQLISFYSSCNIQLNIKTQQFMLYFEITYFKYFDNVLCHMMVQRAWNYFCQEQRIFFNYRKFWNFLIFTSVQVWLLWNGISSPHCFYTLRDNIPRVFFFRICCSIWLVRFELSSELFCSYQLPIYHCWIHKH